MTKAPNDDELVRRHLQSEYELDFDDFGVILKRVSGALR